MLHQDAYASLLERGRRAGADFTEIYVERWRRRLLRTLDGSVEEATSSIEHGAGVRLFFGQDVVYGYTNDVREDAIAELLASLAALRGGNGQASGAGRPDAAGRGGLDLRKRDAGPDIHAPSVAFDTRDKAWRVERLREVDAGARIAPEIQQVDARLIEWEQDVTVANSDGAWVDDRRVRTRLVAQVIASDGSETQTGAHGPGLSMGLELLDRNPPAAVGERAAEMAMLNLRARKAPAGTMPVVIGNGFGGVIFHEALGHLLETTAEARTA